VAVVPLIAAAGVGGRCERIYWGFSYRRVSMKAKPAAGCPHGVTCLRLSMLTDIAKPDLHLFGSCASATSRLSAVNQTAIFGTDPAKKLG